MSLTKEDLQAIGELMDEKLKQSEKRMIARIEDSFEMSADMMRDTEKRINIRMDDGFSRIDGKLAGVKQEHASLREEQSLLRADMNKGFQEISETITEIVDIMK